jgi:hypothetical protein
MGLHSRVPTRDAWNSGAGIGRARRPTQAWTTSTRLAFLRKRRTTLWSIATWSRRTPRCGFFLSVATAASDSPAVHHRRVRCSASQVVKGLNRHRSYDLSLHRRAFASPSPTFARIK